MTTVTINYFFHCTAHLQHAVPPAPPRLSAPVWLPRADDDVPYPLATPRFLLEFNDVVLDGGEYPVGMRVPSPMERSGVMPLPFPASERCKADAEAERRHASWS